MGTIVRYSAQNSTNSSVINRIQVTGSYSVTLSDYYIGVDASTPGPLVVITLPSAAAAGNGKVFVIKDEAGYSSTRNINIAPTGSDSVDGSALGYTLVINYESITVVSDGVSKWYII